ncbi:hypothetical protein EDD21DRAFT_354420 [Dissophora ornata]|nr:hypothetical protein EDD21DRAFT_354420 [Dissophora ornata]
MEVIARFPIHSLKNLDDLWRRVQLGSVIKVYGDIELSERNIGNEETNNPQQQQPRWSALLHCLDFDVVELWQGKEAFEPNPGSSVMQESSRNKRRDHNQNGSSKEQRKRKSGEMEDGLGQVLGSGEKKQERGDESQPHCKFWLNSGKCNKELCLFWHETDPVKLKVERRRWVEERIQAKRQISHHASDPHQKTTKNQHRERALYFAHWLIKTFTRDFLSSGAGVLDIAGGRGDLSWELQTRQGIRSTIVEPRSGKGMRKWQRKWLQKFMADNNRFVSPASASALAIMVETEEGDALEKMNVEDPEEQEPDGGKDFEGLGDFIPTTLTYALQATEPARMQSMLDDKFLVDQQDLVDKASIMIGLHPDQATEPIVRAALKAGKPFAVIPCCVFGRENPHRRLPRAPADFSEKEHEAAAKEDVDGEDDASTRPVTSYDDFVTWLSTLHPEIETTWLNFEGMNRVLFWRGLPSSDEV